MNEHLRMMIPLSMCLLLAGCDIHGYVPDTNEILKPGTLENDFLIEEKNVRGVYGNFDVNSDVYSYETASSSADEFWTQLEKNLNNDDWTRIHDVGPNIRQYIRIRLIEEPGPQWSIVGATIGLNPSNKKVAVGFVFTYRRKKPDPVQLPSEETGFAEDHIWPLIKESISSKQER